MDGPLAYYNENDPFAAAWLVELIKEGVIADGVVDTRDIQDVAPTELEGYSQWHLFAGIGVWSYALRLAGWSDDLPVLTVSCPCQPYSAAGKGAGFADERHLWPAAFHIIEAIRPPCIFGEQVTAAIKHGWLDLVADDMEGIGYSFWPEAFPACSVGAYHQRKRLYFVGEPKSNGWVGWSDNGYSRRWECSPRQTGPTNRLDHAIGNGAQRSRTGEQIVDARCTNDELADPEGGGWRQNGCDIIGSVEKAQGRQRYRISGTRKISGLGIADSPRPQPGQPTLSAVGYGNTFDSASSISFWHDCEWIYCRDGKYRPIPRATESSVERMAARVTDDLGLVCLQNYPDHTDAEDWVYAPLIQKGKARVGRLRGYGNALCAPQAETFIRAYIEMNASGLRYPRPDAINDTDGH